MSAIFGQLRFDGTIVDRTVVDRMAAILVHRGPDARRIVVDDRIGMGYVLRRVTREDSYDAQPIQDRDVTVTADIRLDNRPDLATMLDIAPERLVDLPDSEILLAAYRRWGERCVDYLIGDFCFAIRDHGSDTLLLARDPMGQRGMFFHHGRTQFVWASEIKALWAVPEIPRALSDEMIGHTLLFSLDRPVGATLYEGISILPGGTVLVVRRDGSIDQRRYWRPHAAPEHVGRDDAYYVAAYRRVLGEAVACRVDRLERSPALLFSGGFDSGCIAALATPVLRPRGQRIVAVAAVLPPGTPGRDARPLVEAYRDPCIDLHYWSAGPDDTPFDRLSTTFASSDAPVATDYVRRGLYRTAREAGAAVVLDGMGGDYTLHRRTDAALGHLWRTGGFRSFCRAFAARRRVTGLSVLRSLRDEVVRALLPSSILQLREWIARGRRPVWMIRAIRKEFALALIARGAVNPARLRQRRQVHERGGALHERFLRRVSDGAPVQTILAGAHGLDFTRPFHDRRVVELALAMPDHIQFAHGLERHLPRTVFADILPAALIDRPSGNVPMNPTDFATNMKCVSPMLDEARRSWGAGATGRYIDLERIAALVADATSQDSWSQIELQMAVQALSLGEFISWFDQVNAADQGG